MSTMQNTVLYEQHLALAAKMGHFGNWNMPIQYSGILDEREQCRTQAALFDTCHMGILQFKGDITASDVEFACTNSIENIAVNKCSYGMLLSDEGGIVDDLIIYKITPDELMIVINASTIEQDKQLFESCMNSSGRIDVLSPQLAKVDLQGPASRSVLEDLFGQSLSDLNYFSFKHLTFSGESILVSRTGYTGELGFELYISSEKIGQLWDTLLSYNEVSPAGLGARDLLRLEMGYPLSGSDIYEEITPLQAVMENFVNFDKNFRGKQALLKEKEEGVKRKKIAFKSDGRRAPRHGFTLAVNNNEVGFVTSGIFSPVENCGIGVGYIDTKILDSGISSIDILHGTRSFPATIVSLPFYKNGTARLK